MDIIKLGDTCTDNVTGIEGIVTGIYTFLTGSTRYCLEYVDSTGRHASSDFDEERLTIKASA